MAAMWDVGVVVVAAGTGSRSQSSENAGELKQFRWVAGKPMLLHSIQAFQARTDVGMVVCVLPRDRVADPPPWIFQSDTDRLLLSVGGAERADSVRNGLEELPAELPIILIHDAARPFAPPEMVDRVIGRVREGSVAVPALPVSDTIKEVDSAGSVLATVDRSRLFRAQTPQGFPRDVLLDAHRNALKKGLAATDDAALCELIGARVTLVEGSERAMKITTALDFAVAEALVNAAAK